MNDPIEHTSNEHESTFPVYSPNCNICLDQIEKLMNAVFDRWRAKGGGK